MSLGFNLSFEDFSVPLGFIKVLRKSIELLLLTIKLNSVSCVDVLLDLHSEDVRVNWHRHLVGQTFDLLLFLFNGSPHIIYSLLHARLCVLARLHFFSQSLLVLRSLLAHLLIVNFELGVQTLDFFFFCVGGLQMSFYSCKSSL